MLTKAEIEYRAVRDAAAEELGIDLIVSAVENGIPPKHAEKMFDSLDSDEDEDEEDIDEEDDISEDGDDLDDEEEEDLHLAPDNEVPKESLNEAQREFLQMLVDRCQVTRIVRRNPKSTEYEICYRRKGRNVTLRIDGSALRKISRYYSVEFPGFSMLSMPHTLDGVVRRLLSRK